MMRIENEAQYKWALAKVEALLPLVDDQTSLDDPNSIELELLSNLVADYSDIHFAIGEPTLVEAIKQHRYITLIFGNTHCPCRPGCFGFGNNDVFNRICKISLCFTAYLRNIET